MRFHRMDRDAAMAELQELISDTVVAKEELATRLEQGRDRVLELNSFRAETADVLVRRIRETDSDESIDAFLNSVFDHFSIPVDEIAHRTYQLGSAGVLADVFPGLPTTGLTITCDRGRALSREDIQFVTWDHPLVSGALDVILGSEKGNSTFAWWPDTRVSALYLEAFHLIECVAPPSLHIDRFLPPTPLRVLIDHRGADVSAVISVEALAAALQRGDPAILGAPAVREDVLPRLLKESRAIVERRAPPMVVAARRKMAEQLDHEIARLSALRGVNPSVRIEEIDLLIAQKSSLDRCLEGAGVQLDAIRLIRRGP